jgi:hypothetical protein
VVVCNPPLLRGVTEALKSERIREIIDLYPMVDLFVLCVDRDGIIGRRDRLQQLEEEFAAQASFFGSFAWEELETWTLAGLALPAEWNWATIRGDVSVKENWFEPLAIRLGVIDGPGGGRKQLGEQAARNVDVIRRKCPEDFGHLAVRIKALLDADAV